MELIDDRYKPMPNDVIIEPKIKKSSLLIEDPKKDRVPATIEGVIIKTGIRVTDPDLKAGTPVVFVPHGGQKIPVPEGHPERLVLPHDQIVGILVSESWNDYR